MSINFYPNKLTCAILGAAAIATTSYSVNAQEQEKSDAKGEIEVIEVTGIRGSIVQSMNNKRFSNNIVDTISAEDIGKFPDSNLAESLQRITGVSIDRSDDGEGQSVSVRGMGPSFTTTTLNGREVATEGQGRAFGFDVLASEIVSAVDVHKTSQAAHLEGGIGGSIDIKTARPFNYDGFHAAGNIGLQKESNQGDVTPQASFLVTNTFLDDRFGVLAAFTYQNRKSESYNVSGDVMRKRQLTLREHGRDDNGSPVNFGKTDVIYYGQNLIRGVSQNERERIGGNLVAQFSATDDLMFTADYLYSKLDTEVINNVLGSWTGNANSVEFFDDGNEIPTVSRMVRADESTAQTGGYRSQYRPATTQMLALNAEWQINDSLSLVADFAWSEAENDNKGLDERLDLGLLNTPHVTWDYTSGRVPSIYHSQPGVTVPSDANLTNFVPRHIQRSGNYSKGENKQAKFDFSWEADLGALTSVNFGYHYINKSKSNDYYTTPDSMQKVYQHIGANGLGLTSDVLTLVDYGNVFPATNLGAEFFEINPDAFFNQVTSAESLAFMEALRPDDYVTFLERGGNASAWDADPSGAGYTIDETINSFYVDANLEGEVDGMSWNIVAGVRYSDTKQESVGAFQTLLDLTPALDEFGEEFDNLLKTYSGVTVGTVDNDYDHFLPSVSGNLAITEELILRAAASKTLTRPTLTALAPSLSYGGTTKQSRTATGTNPNLQPFESTNLDLSLEWYYNEASLLSIAYFKKDVDNFIVRTNSDEVFDITLGGNEPDPAWRTFAVSRPRNGQTAEIDGFEVNWTHAFDNGFGFQANATFTDSNAELDDNNPEQIFALEGLSDSANLVAFYEQGPVQLRLAYNIRGKFLQNQEWGPESEPRYVEEYKQLDASGSYEIDDNFSVFFKAVNITGAEVFKHGRYTNHFLYYSDTGPRYQVGIRAKF